MALTTIDDRGLKTPIDLLDNEKIRFGTSNDLEIYHWGHSVIENTNAAALLIASDETNVVNNAMSETLAKFIANGGVELYHDNAKVLYTHPNGAIVKRPSGGETELAVYGCEGNDAIILLAGDDGDDNGDYFRLMSDASHHVFYLQNYASGGWESNIKAAGNGAVELYYDNSKKLETYTSGITVQGHIKANQDDSQLILGAGNDLKLWHDGSNSIISDEGTGNLQIRTDGANIQLNKGTTENMLVARTDGAVELFYDNSKKLQTYSGGVNVLDGQAYTAGDGYDLQVYHTGSHGYIYNNTGTFFIRGSSSGHNIRLQAKEGEDGVYIKPDGAVELYHDNVKTFLTDSHGITVQGPEGGNGIINLFADEGDDVEDKYRLNSKTNGDFAVENYRNGSGWETNLTCTGDGAVDLYYDNSKKFETKDKGIAIQSGQRECNLTLQNDARTWKIVNYDYGNNGTDHLGFHDGSSDRVIFQNTGGISFNGDTAAANALSDYEEGTWTFNVYSGTINNDGTTSGRVCKYRKVGGTVHFWFDFFQVNNNMELVGTVVISGLPFTPETEFHAHMNVATYNGSGSGTALSNYLENNARLVLHGNGTVSSIRHLWGFGSYPVTD